MTVKIENLTIDHDDRAWALGSIGTDITLDETYRLDFLSVVRHIMRERSDCTMIPVVVAAVRFTNGVNEWGHNGEIEVQYDRRYRAIYGVHFGERVSNVQCYMD